MTLEQELTFYRQLHGAHEAAALNERDQELAAFLAEHADYFAQVCVYCGDHPRVDFQSAYEQYSVSHAAEGWSHQGCWYKAHPDAPEVTLA